MNFPEFVTHVALLEKGRLKTTLKTRDQTRTGFALATTSPQNS